MEDLLFTRRTASLSRMRRVGLVVPSLAVFGGPLLVPGQWLGAAVVVGGLVDLTVLLNLIFRGAWT